MTIKKGKWFSKGGGRGVGEVLSGEESCYRGRGGGREGVYLSNYANEC
jgi:hypothetical protein